MTGTIAPLRLALAQIDSTVGDIEHNAAKISEYLARARDAGAELVLFPELALTGYPPEDLLLKEHFLLAAREACRARRLMVAATPRRLRPLQVLYEEALLPEGGAAARLRPAR